MNRISTVLLGSLAALIALQAWDLSHPRADIWAAWEWTDDLEARENRRVKSRFAYESRTLGVERFREGRKAFGKGDLSLAYLLFRSASILVPEWDLPLLELAELHPLYDNDLTSQRAALKRAVALNPLNPRSRLLLGVALAQAGEREEAVEHFREALRHRPDYEEVHFRLASLLREMGRTEEALKEYEWVATAQPHNTLLLAQLADLYEQAGRPSDAERTLLRLAHLDPGNPNGFVHLARFYERRNRPDRAREMWKKAETLRPSEGQRKMRPLPKSRR